MIGVLTVAVGWVVLVVSLVVLVGLWVLVPAGSLMIVVGLFVDLDRLIGVSANVKRPQ